MIKRDFMPDIMTIIGYAVAALFVVLGFYMILSPKMVNMQKEFRTIFGVVVIGYGLFRSVIIFQKSKQRKESDDETDY
jgi:heme/copper-type cytochrome/quinol oxidase subunit 4